MRLRFENFEQFTTLVKMHLSFELDLHTEEYVIRSHLNIVVAYRAPGSDRRRHPLYLSLCAFRFCRNEESFHEKGLFKKFNRFSKKTKPNCASSKTSNSPEQDRQILTKELITKLGHIAEFLVKEESKADFY